MSDSDVDRLLDRVRVEASRARTALRHNQLSDAARHTRRAASLLQAAAAARLALAANRVDTQERNVTGRARFIAARLSTAS